MFFLELKKIAEALSEIEKGALKALSQEFAGIEEISARSGLQIDSVRRAVAWLEEKKLLEIII